MYLWADGIYLKAGLGKEKTALLVVIGVNEKGEKELLAMAEGYRESTESWRDVLRDLKQRGLQDPKLVIGDGSLGLWSAVSEVFPEAKQQHCWCHKMTNVLDKLPRPVQPEAKVLLRDIYNAPTAEVKNRATITGAIEIGRLPGVVQVTFLAPLERLERVGLLPFVREQYDLL